MEKIGKNIPNVALMFGVGLFPLITVTATLKTALVYAAMLFLVILLSELLVDAFKVIIAKRIRFIAYALVVLSVVYFIDSAGYELFHKNYSSLHSLVVLIFGCTVIFYSLEKNKDELSFSESVKSSMSIGSEYALTIILVGAVREFLTFGTIWGKVVIDGFNGSVFFGGLAGGLLIVLLFALIYNVIILFVQKRVRLSRDLTIRYTKIIEKNADEVKVNTEAASIEKED